MKLTLQPVKKAAHFSRIKPAECAPPHFRALKLHLIWSFCAGIAESGGHDTRGHLIECVGGISRSVSLSKIRQTMP